MTLPRLTPLQFLVLSLLLKGETRGRDLRTGLRQEGVRQSGPAFYQMMAILEDGGLVQGRYEQQVVDEQIVRERYYKVLAQGRKAWRECYDFFARQAHSVGELAREA